MERTSPEYVDALEEKIRQLELTIKLQDEQLASEREITSKAKKKVHQLLAKIAQRDEALADLRAALERARSEAAVPEARPGAASMRVISMTGDASKSSLRGGSGTVVFLDSCREAALSADRESPRSRAATSRDMAARERAEIVAQLEEHLAQMRMNLAESVQEVSELESRRRSKEEELASGAGLKSVESGQVIRQALVMIEQQIQEKRRFADELTQKTRDLEEQVVRQRDVIEEMVSRRGSLRQPEEEDPEADGAGGVHATWRGPSADVCEDEALGAFLAAAGPAAEPIASRPALLAAFEESPPRLSGDLLEGCDEQVRIEVLSLFTAWVAVAGEAPRALILEEMELKVPDVTELTGTLESCNAELDELDVTRCPMSEVTLRLLLETLAAQSLRRLNLGYNALGCCGAAALVSFLPSWTDSLLHLSLEMNGLGDSGCEEVAGALRRGVLPRLRVLELGWNELSASCAPALVALLRGFGEEAADPDRTVPLRLERLGLGGNRLQSEGAIPLALAALDRPGRMLDLDLSMNHIDNQPLTALTQWAQQAAQDSDISVTINLEWNVMDDGSAVQSFARAVSGAGLTPADPGRPLVRLGNNELAESETSDIAAASRGLIAC